MVSPRQWVQDHRAEILARYRPDGSTRGHTFEVDGQEMPTADFAKLLIRGEKLKNMNSGSLAAEIATMLRNNGTPATSRRTRKRPDPEILRKPEVFTVAIPGGGEVLVSTRDTKTRLLFEVEVKKEEEG